jgi:hypothetical protein
MNEINRILINESDKEFLNIKDVRATVDLVNKELFISKSLLENFFIKFNENKNLFKNTTQNEYVKIIK